MRLIVALLLLAMSTACAAAANEEKQVPLRDSRANASQALLEAKDYKVNSYEGVAHSYTLTKEKLTELPYMMYWGLQSVDPLNYVGKEIIIDKFVVEDHPLAKGKVEVYVYSSEGQPFGGTSVPYRRRDDGGYWSMDGKTLEEIQPKSFQEWQKAWMARYTP
ncbi:hypothetical protein IDH41_10755 [Paenibacillus sp. IB182493]|uniref:Lipoprotein n=2 Tax=Paenibacillus arenilitoris TaxID=2772299 RepID=A0A927H5L2_9BACL|nr:hypothetical protein [Paenibacillus arenilitoris]